ncbi:MAG: CPBP family intramembrane metalloprotease [Sphaerochaetaceae bacterium]|nr:CPBP family intramembrane metalloprotease [Sphaerochaetaceae bacterium]
MQCKKKPQRLFIGFTFIWSFIFWGLSIFLALKGNIELLESGALLQAILHNNIEREVRTITILNTLAGYGPLLAAIFITIYMPTTRKHFTHRFKFNTPFRYILQIIGLFLLITIIPAIPLFISKGFSTAPTWSLLGFSLLFFGYQFITAATEEIGWRGYLLPTMLQEKTPWQASLRIGLIWALWHTPIILYVFYTQGLPVFQIIISFIGFIAGTIAMATVHTYYYLKTKNILFNMFIHAIGNTFPMLAGLVIASSYEISVAVQILLWVFVFIITKKNKDLFDTLQEL